MTQRPAAFILVIEPDESPVPWLLSCLAEVPAIVEAVVSTGPVESALHPAPTLVVMVAMTSDDLTELARTVKTSTRSPLLAVTTPDLVALAASHSAIDDFWTVGTADTELQARVRRLLRLHPDSGEILRRGDLAINTATCEVSLGGRLIELTFKEYSLLKFLATNPGRVHSREVLLNKVWGYDYYGGDRTVDVHVRRLRSKIEDANHEFIDTIRNMGYRFRKDI